MSDETVNPEAMTEKEIVTATPAADMATVPETAPETETVANTDTGPIVEAAPDVAITAETAPVAEAAPIVVEETPVAAEMISAAAADAPTTAAVEPVVEDTKPASKSKAKAVKEAPVEVIAVPAEPDTIDFGAKKDPVRGRRKVRTGRVVSSKMEKTVVVAVESRKRHPLYGKFMRHTSKFKAHDEANTCGEGDTVEIMETRPISKEKRWRVVRIIERAK